MIPCLAVQSFVELIEDSQKVLQKCFTLATNWQRKATRSCCGPTRTARSGSFLPTENSSPSLDLSDFGFEALDLRGRVPVDEGCSGSLLRLPPQLSLEPLFFSQSPDSVSRIGCMDTVGICAKIAAWGNAIGHSGRPAESSLQSDNGIGLHSKFFVAAWTRDADVRLRTRLA